jgi:hypothetical protein
MDAQAMRGPLMLIYRESARGEAVRVLRRRFELAIYSGIRAGRRSQTSGTSKL